MTVASPSSTTPGRLVRVAATAEAGDIVVHDLLTVAASLHRRVAGDPLFVNNCHMTGLDSWNFMKLDKR
jgi:hypothetical protein